MMNLPYTKDDLLAEGTFSTYPDDATECAFLLGGIGTGNISIGSRGQLRDWEIFDKPAKGVQPPYTFFAIHSTDQDGKPIAKVLEAQRKPPYKQEGGYLSQECAGLLRFDRSHMSSEYPFVRVTLTDDQLPLDVELEAYTPFIPLDADRSGIPGAVLRYRVKNLSDEERTVSIAASIANLVGYCGCDFLGTMQVKARGQNEIRRTGDLTGLYYTCPSLAESDLSNGSMAIASNAQDVSIKAHWLDGSWFDGIHDFWDDFEADGRLNAPKAVSNVETAFNAHSTMQFGSVCATQSIPAGAKRDFTFYLTWYFPNRPKAWMGHLQPEKDTTDVIRKYYATRFTDAWHVAETLWHDRLELEGLSRSFSRALYDSTLPAYVIEALANNITVIRSQTCFRIEDGTFLAWEGVFRSRGSCEGNCTHVWNYAQTLAFLFPTLERSMLETSLLIETEEDGSMPFRALRIFGGEKWKLLPAVDGQLGVLLRLYRYWMLTRDDAFVRRVWPKAQKALEFAFVYWDQDHDGLLESQQHNTYDIEFYGPNSMINSIFFAALRASSQLADLMGDKEASQRYAAVAAQGSANLDALLWNGEYYDQRIDDVNAYRYQYGSGCLSDQLLGQTLAHVCNLGYIMPEAHVRSAIQSVYKYNFRTSMQGHNNVQRTYALADEKGLLLCSWPHGGRPDLPFVYCDEVWTGIEYQVATHLIFEGNVEAGLTIVKALRERFDGFRRSPWNEMECGDHYARSLASWALLPALSGFRIEAGHPTFSPRIHDENFSCFYSTGTEWGIYQQRKDCETGACQAEINVIYRI